MTEVTMGGGSNGFDMGKLIESIMPMIMQLVQLILTMKIFSMLVGSFSGLL